MKSSSLQFYLLTPEHTELSACGARCTPALQSKRQFCTGTGGGGMGGGGLSAHSIVEHV